MIEATFLRYRRGRRRAWIDPGGAAIATDDRLIGETQTAEMRGTTRISVPGPLTGPPRRSRRLRSFTSLRQYQCLAPRARSELLFLFRNAYYLAASSNVAKPASGARRRRG